MKRTLYSTRYKLMTDELRRAREHRGWSQAHAAHVVGSSRSWIGKIERTELRLDIVQLIHICQCYGIGFNRLLRRLEEEPSDEEGSFYLSGGFTPTPMRRMANTAVRMDSGSRSHVRTASNNSGGRDPSVHSRVHTHVPPLILLEWVVGSNPSASTIFGRGSFVPRFFCRFGFGSCPKSRRPLSSARDHE